MAFGQASGSPATGKQVQELLGLLNDAGHSDFRDARGPMGFTQRQAGGKFTRDEAEAFIAQLQQEVEAAESAASAAPTADAPAPAAAAPIPARRLTAADQAIRKLTDQQLAAELQRRGWIVIEP